MTKYIVTLATTASFTIEVDADDEDAAIEIGYAEAPREVCAQCSGWGQSWELAINDEWELDEPTATAVQS